MSFVKHNRGQIQDRLAQRRGGAESRTIGLILNPASLRLRARHNSWCSNDLGCVWSRGEPSAASGRDRRHISRKKRKKAQKGRSRNGPPPRLFCVFLRSLRLHPSAFFASSSAAWQCQGRRGNIAADTVPSTNSGPALSTAEGLTPIHACPLSVIPAKLRPERSRTGRESRFLNHEGPRRNA